MWNSIKGVNPPIKKRKTEDKTLYYSEYESSKIIFLKCVTIFAFGRLGTKTTIVLVSVCIVHAQTPLACSDSFAVLTGDSWATSFFNLGAQMAAAYKS